MPQRERLSYRPPPARRLVQNGHMCECNNAMNRLQRLAGRAHKIPQDRDVRAIGTDAPSVDRQAEALGEIQIDTGVVQFRQAKTLRRQYAIQARGIDGTRRPVALPGTARQLVKLLPIAFVPSRHASICYYHST